MREAVYRALIASPPEETRGWTRWWWYGCCVDRAEIERELTFMKEAGIGGVELQILYPVVPDDPQNGFFNIPFGSPEFYDVLAFTQRACAARGMGFDFTPGSSWPYGGPFVTDEDAQQEAIPYQLDLRGPRRFACDFTTRFAGTVAAATLGKMEKCVMRPETVKDVTGCFTPKMLFGWPWGTELAGIDIPEGDWKLCFFVISQHRNRVGKPGRDAEGRVIDHCSARAMDVFLDNMARPVARRVPGIRAYFCDSIEVEGHNWSGVLLPEFKRRRGYDLAPYIYALWGDMGEITPHVRYDYFQTMSELTIENFFDKLTAFAHEHGALSRIQAHGTWGDILRAYAAADIPEGETFGDHRTLEVNTIHRRLAASAGHVYGKNIISNETFTWLKRPRFTETLEEMKAAVDAVFLDGINMIVNHGYAYSPENAGKRGWPFYASTHINHTTPWWPFYHHLAAYIQSVSAVLRRGFPVRDVAVYLPQPDIYADNMLSELHLAMRLEEHLGRAQMDAIEKAGYWFDYVNDEALTSLSTIQDGRLVIGDNAYRAVLLVGCTRLPVDTAQALCRYARSGGLLIAAETIPGESCGLIDHAENAALVRAAMTEAFECENAVLAKDRGDGLIGALAARLTPDVRLSDPEAVGYVHRRDGDDEIYFFSNVSEKPRAVAAAFRDDRGRARLFSAIGGDLLPLSQKGRTVAFSLDAHESVFCVFSGDFTEEIPAPEKAAAEETELTGWTLRVPETGFSAQMQTPRSWERFDALAAYSGEGWYETAFDWAGAPDRARLRLTGLSCAAAVYVNGERAGDLWTKPYRLDITAHLRPGRNEVSVRVASTLINEMRRAADDPLCARELPGWPYYGEVINNQRRARLTNRREREEQTAPLPSGLWGGVYLERG